MNAEQSETILGLPRRPKISDASASTILWAVAGGLLAGPARAVLGGIVGNAVGNQRQPLEMAIRSHFRERQLELLFYYPFQRGVRVSFRTNPDTYWTLESVLPEQHLQYSSEDQFDWIYGNLISVELPKALWQMQRAS
jgi:hypothetical protein